jgi:hypothetical protein
MTRRIGAWLAASYIFRQLVYIGTVGFILWVPGLLALLLYGASTQNSFNRPTVLSVGLFWWSIWLSSAWVAIWVCSLVASLVPIVLRRFLGRYLYRLTESRMRADSRRLAMLQASLLLPSRMSSSMQRLPSGTLPFSSGQFSSGSSICRLSGLNSLAVKLSKGAQSIPSLDPILPARRLPRILLH